MRQRKKQTQEKQMPTEEPPAIIPSLGFRFTEGEEKAMLRTKIDSILFMRKFGKGVGYHPSIVDVRHYANAFGLYSDAISDDDEK